jgi:hypothetical protein
MSDASDVIAKSDKVWYLLGDPDCPGGFVNDCSVGPPKAKNIQANVYFSERPVSFARHDYFGLYAKEDITCPDGGMVELWCNYCEGPDKDLFWDPVKDPLIHVKYVTTELVEDSDSEEEVEDEEVNTTDTGGDDGEESGKSQCKAKAKAKAKVKAKVKVPIKNKKNIPVVVNDDDDGVEPVWAKGKGTGKGKGKGTGLKATHEAQFGGELPMYTLPVENWEEVTCTTCEDKFIEQDDCNLCMACGENYFHTSCEWSEMPAGLRQEMSQFLLLGTNNTTPYKPRVCSEGCDGVEETSEGYNLKFAVHLQKVKDQVLEITKVKKAPTAASSTSLGTTNPATVASPPVTDKSSSSQSAATGTPATSSTKSVPEDPTPWVAPDPCTVCGEKLIDFVKCTTCRQLVHRQISCSTPLANELEYRCQSCTLKVPTTFFQNIFFDFFNHQLLGSEGGGGLCFDPHL